MFYGNIAIINEISAIFGDSQNKLRKISTFAVLQIFWTLLAGWADMKNCVIEYSKETQFCDWLEIL